jgi:hypothetical protein
MPSSRPAAAPAAAASAGLDHDQREDLLAGHAQTAQDTQHGTALHHREHHGVVDQEHP